MPPHDVFPWEAIDTIRELHPGFPREAYAFVMASLGVAVESLPAERMNDADRRHLSGGELLVSVASLARREFGDLARTVFDEWGLRSNEDVGTIVFQLVEIGQLKARPQDSIDDFRGGPDLLESLDPARRLRTDPPQPADH